MPVPQPERVPRVGSSCTALERKVFYAPDSCNCSPPVLAVQSTVQTFRAYGHTLIFLCKLCGVDLTDHLGLSPRPFVLSLTDTWLQLRGHALMLGEGIGNQTIPLNRPQVLQNHQMKAHLAHSLVAIPRM